ncbi:ABC transporter permease subunit [Sediminibacillus massiliensis]|uniref:ABC transporter permease subunit n=1 Tax=Sediminibacillus massiliensis TaxID=1926277 RepID=UPI0015C32661|nr:ABC transporter permease subunit [Sediminibacillus massiliensis]
MKFVKLLVYYVLGVLGIICVSAAPSLMFGEGLLDFGLYLSNTWSLIGDFLHPDRWVYQFMGRDWNVFAFLWDSYLYSMTLLFGALLLGFGVALALAVITQFLPKPLIGAVKRLLGMMEAIPDLLVAFLFQMLIVYIYKQTDIYLMKFVTLGEERIYLAPICILAILPMISLYRIILLLIEEELTKDYAEFALSKGVRFNAIIFYHILRNTARSIFYHSKIILWGALSSLFVIEYLFNIRGISSLVLDNYQPMVVAAALIMLYTPFYFLYQGVAVFTEKDTATAGNIRFRIGFGRTFKQGSGLSERFSRFVKGIGAHLRNPKFLFGLTLILVILTVSIIHTVVQEEPVKNFNLIYDDEGNLISTKPHPPSQYVLLGTDRLGYSILDQLLSGAKYTILFAALIAFLRMFLGFILAVPYAMFVSDRWKRGLERFVDGFHFLPLSIIALILLRPVLMGTTSGFEYSLTIRILVEVAVLTLLVVPLVTVLIGNEIKLISRQEYIISARTIGGDSNHILFRHIMPHLRSKLGIIFGQQFIQVLLILIHLGLFDIFFGGTSIMYDESYKAPPHSVTYEWSGLISSTRTAFMSGHEWIVVPVFVAFIIVIIAMQFIVEGIQEVQQERVGVVLAKRSFIKRLFDKQKSTQVEERQTELKKGDFDFIERDSRSDELA